MSLKRIAELTGASVATVSRVLNNPDYCCQKKGLTEKIRETARMIHYIPDSSARELKFGNMENSKEKMRKVDLLMARFDTLREDPFFYEVFRYVETELMNQQMVLGDILNVPDISLRQGKKLESDGLIILGKCSGHLVGELHKMYRGIVAIDRNPMEYEMDEIVCNGAAAASLAVEHLIGLGHRKIGYIGDCNMESRFVGYYECLQKHHISLTYDYVVSTRQTKEEGKRAYDLLAAKEQRPTAVFCANDVTAEGFLSSMKLRNKGKRKHVYRPAVVSMDDIQDAGKMTPALTTVHIPKEDMAHLAVLILRDRLQGKHGEYLRLELPCHLVVRESATNVSERGR